MNIYQSCLLLLNSFSFYERAADTNVSHDPLFQQNTSSLWSINEPFHIRLLHGSRVNAAEGMKVGFLLLR